VEAFTNQKKEFLGDDDFNFPRQKKVSAFKLIKEGEWLEKSFKIFCSDTKIHTLQSQN
jgi:hypothetical protein